MVGALVLAVLFVPTSRAVDKDKQVKPAPAASVTTPPKPGGSAQQTDGCKAQEKNLRRSMAKGADQQVCIRPSTPEEERQADPGQLKRKLADHRPKDYVPIPEWCWDHAQQGWWVNREHACKIASKTAEVRRLPTWNRIGEIYYMEINYAYTDASETTWNNQPVVDKSGGWGPIAGAQVQGTGTCRGQCNVDYGRFPPQTLSKDKVAYGEFVLASNVGANQRGNGRNLPAYFMTVPGAVPSPLEVDETETIRCDDELRDKRAGCIVPSYAPDWEVSLTGT